MWSGLMRMGADSELASRSAACPVRVAVERATLLCAVRRRKLRRDDGIRSYSFVVKNWLKLRTNDRNWNRQQGEVTTTIAGDGSELARSSVTRGQPYQAVPTSRYWLWGGSTSTGLQGSEQGVLICCCRSMRMKKNVFVIIGSASQNSSNRRLIDRIAELTADQLVLTTLEGWERLT